MDNESEAGRFASQKEPALTSEGSSFPTGCFDNWKALGTDYWDSSYG